MTRRSRWKQGRCRWKGDPSKRNPNRPTNTCRMRALYLRWRIATANVGRKGGCAESMHKAEVVWERADRLRHQCAAAQDPGVSENVPNQEKITLQVNTQRGALKGRLDAFLSDSLPDYSRAKLQRSIKDGRVTVNGRATRKPGQLIKSGDLVEVEKMEEQAIGIEPEAIPLDIVFEDEHLLVVNKQAGLVVHPAVGNYSGTLVNGILHHCSLPALHIHPADYRNISGNQVEEWIEGDDSQDDSTATIFEQGIQSTSTVRPGIVHRLDKGTTGLMVVAKDAHSHEELSRQFMERVVSRRYTALVCGVPKEPFGRVEAVLGRDPKNRKRMSVVPEGRRGGRYAASNYQVVEVLAGGAAAVLEWKLETGRTHQIRVHSQHLGHPIIGDETYGGVGKGAVFQIARHTGAAHVSLVRQAIAAIARPALHAKTLGFTHPATGEELFFSSDIPTDLEKVISLLKQIE